MSYFYRDSATMRGTAFNTPPNSRQAQSAESPAPHGGYYSNPPEQPGVQSSYFRGVDVLGSTIIGSYFDSPRDVRPLRPHGRESHVAAIVKASTR